jgi:hypothetical protein
MNASTEARPGGAAGVVEIWLTGAEVRLIEAALSAYKAARYGSALDKVARLRARLEEIRGRCPVRAGEHVIDGGGGMNANEAYCLGCQMGRLLMQIAQARSKRARARLNAAMGRNVASAQQAGVVVAWPPDSAASRSGQEVLRVFRGEEQLWRAPVRQAPVRQARQEGRKAA